MGWISVKDKLPPALHGSSYQTWGTGPVLVIHDDRPDYPITAHAFLGDNLAAKGVCIPTNGASEYKEIAWYPAPGTNAVNPFGLKDQDYERFLPRRFGTRITHWMPLLEAPNKKLTGAALFAASERGTSGV